MSLQLILRIWFRHLSLALLLAFVALGPARPANFDLSPLNKNDWTLGHAKHLLERAGFGANYKEINRVYRLGPEQAVLLTLNGGAIERIAPFKEFEHSGIFDQSLDPFPPSRPALTAAAKISGEGLGIKVREGVNRPLQPIVNKFFYWLRASRLETDRIVYWWANEMLATDHPLKEKIALFWHGHFAVNEDKVRDYRKMLGMLKLLRKHGLGSAKDLVNLVAKDPAMLVFLDAGVNTKNAPNENFAREIMEMFTLGDGKYSERDVREGARAFTGWEVEGLNFNFASTNHDNGKKTFLNETGSFGGEDIIEIIFEQNECGDFIASKLFTFFVTENVPPLLRSDLGEILRTADYDVSKFLHTIFLSKGFYSEEVVGQRIKGPVELMVSTYRKLNLSKVPGNPDFNTSSELMGQRLMHPPTVAGWAGGKSWINPSLLFERNNFVLELVFPDIGFIPPDRAPPFIREVTNVQNRLREGLPVSSATAPTGIDGGMMAESNKNADRDEDFNTRLGSMRGWQMALERVKPIDRHVSSLDLSGYMQKQNVKSVVEAVNALERDFFSLRLGKEQRNKLIAYLTSLLGSDRLNYRANNSESALREFFHKMLSLPEYQMG